MIRASLFAIFLLFAFCCNAQNSKDTTKQAIPEAKKDTILQVNLDTMSVSVPAGPPAYQASATRVWEIKNTRIALTFNYKEKTADVREWITMHPYFYATDSIVLDAKSMRVDSVMLSGPKGKSKLNFVYENDHLKIHFGKQYKATETIEQSGG